MNPTHLIADLPVIERAAAAALAGNKEAPAVARERLMAVIQRRLEGWQDALSEDATARLLALQKKLRASP
jgi:hypothetical protein